MVIYGIFKVSRRGMKMKNKFLNVLSCGLATSMLLTGCTGKVKEEPKDTKAPVIKVDDSALSIEQNCGTELNLKEYFKDKVEVTDNVDKDISYKISANKDYYEKKSGDVDTEDVAEFKGKITATDKTGNKTSKEFSVKLNPIVVSVDNKTPLVYDGKYAKITVLSFRHGNIDGIDEYQIRFEVENRMDKSLLVYLPQTKTSINNYQIDAYYTINSITPGLTGVMECEVYDEDIPDSVGHYTQINTYATLAKDGDEKGFLYIPMILNVDAAEPYSN